VDSAVPTRERRGRVASQQGQAHAQIARAGVSRRATALGCLKNGLRLSYVQYPKLLPSPQMRVNSKIW